MTAVTDQQAQKLMKTFKFPSRYLTDWELCELYGAWLVHTKQTDRVWSRNYFHAWCLRHRLRGNWFSRSHASAALATHRQNPNGRKHTFRRTGWARGTRWHYMLPEEAAQVEQQNLRENIDRIFHEHVYRVVPGAQGDPVVKREIESAIPLIEAQVMIVIEMAERVAILRTNPADDQTRTPVVLNGSTTP